MRSRHRHVRHYIFDPAPTDVFVRYRELDARLCGYNIVHGIARRRHRSLAGEFKVGTGCHIITILPPFSISSHQYQAELRISPLQQTEFLSRRTCRHTVCKCVPYLHPNVTDGMVKSGLVRISTSSVSALITDRTLPAGRLRALSEQAHEISEIGT